jgi:hypothetical protein
MASISCGASTKARQSTHRRVTLAAAWDVAVSGPDCRRIREHAAGGSSIMIAGHPRP